MTAEIEKYRGAALANFSLLKPVFARNGNFWRLGNSFDTTIDFLEWIDPNEAPLFAEYALDRYHKTQGDWFDDYGWWGIASLRASQRASLFPGFADRFHDIASRSWSWMDENAPKVWAKADQVRYREFAPRFAGGVWNAYWTDKCNPITPCDGLQGIQNTVTNGLYLVLAARLAARADCQQAANREYAFLKNWFEAEEPPDCLLAPTGHDGNGAYVRERVSAYASSTPTWAYRESLAWSGDQGLILGGLVDRMIMEPKDYKAMLEIARRIVNGSRQYLVDQTGILLPWQETDGQGAPGGDVGDYMTGPGVFMRYLLYTWRANSDLKASLREVGYLDVVRANADRACDYPVTNKGDDEAMTLLTNNLATLTAAVVMLSDT
jgi:hypothetical protein